MAKLDEFAFLDATAQAELVRKKEVTPAELVEATIERIERLNPELNAVVTPMYDLAREAAKADPGDGPFAGVPFLLKDLGAAYCGVRQTIGSAFGKDNISAHDSELVVRQKRAGLICVGKTNTPEFGLLPTTEPSLFGPSHNPWNTERSPGGSSGGSAAAVAAGIVPMAHANDGGGSIRIPASCCGLFGLKPTRARNPMGPDMGDMLSGYICEHAVTRSVRDSAALLDATSGPDIGDPYWAPPPARPFIEEVAADPGKLKIAFTTDPGTDVKVHEDCKQAVREATELCAELGHEVIEASPPINGDLMVELFIPVWSAGCAWSIEALATMTGQTPSQDQFEPLTWALYEMGRQQTASQYLLAITMFQQMSRAIAGFFEDYDVLITPTATEPPPPLGSFDAPPDDPMQAMVRAGEYVPFTPICNFTGQPAMSVPLMWNADGLPVGTHFVGRFGDEATLFRLAAQLEQARPWSGKRPPVSA